MPSPLAPDPIEFLILFAIGTFKHILRIAENHLFYLWRAVIEFSKTNVDENRQRLKELSLLNYFLQVIM